MRWSDGGSILGHTVLSARATLCIDQVNDADGRLFQCQYVPSWVSLDVSTYTEGSNGDAISVPLAQITAPPYTPGTPTPTPTGTWGPSPTPVCINNVFTMSNPAAKVTPGGHTALRCTISGSLPNSGNAVVEPLRSGYPRLDVCMIPFTPTLTPTLTPTQTPSRTPTITQTPSRTPTP